MAIAPPRIDNDAYYTPPGPVRQILQVLKDMTGLNPGSTVLEPSCGGGNIIHEVITKLGVDEANVTGVDVSDRGFAGIRALHPGVKLHHRSVLDDPPIRSDMTRDLGSMCYRRDFDLCIGNPPYGDDLPELFVRKLMALQNCYTIAFLLRLNWLGSVRRNDLHRRFPPRVYVLSKRPSFSDNGKTDGCEYAWFVWTRYADGGHIEVLPPYEPQAGLFE